MKNLEFEALSGIICPTGCSKKPPQQTVAETGSDRTPTSVSPFAFRMLVNMRKAVFGLIK